MFYSNQSSYPIGARNTVYMYVEADALNMYAKYQLHPTSHLRFLNTMKNHLFVSPWQIQQFGQNLCEMKRAAQ